MSATSSRYLVKPLRTNLIGVIRKLDRLDDTPLNNSMISCALHLLTELERLDVQEVFSES